MTRALTAAAAIEQLRASQGTITDFSARARTTVIENDIPQNATLAVRYLAPDRGRVYIKGFAGIDMARVSLLADSIIVYVPPENYWFGIPRTGGLLNRLLPELGAGLDMLPSLFSTALPETVTDDTASIEQTDDGPVLTLHEGSVTRRLLLSVDPFTVTVEEWYRDDVLEWRKEVGGYREIDGILFPVRLTVRGGGERADFVFSDISLNTGLNETNMRFTIPASAEHLRVSP